MRRDWETRGGGLDFTLRAMESHKRTLAEESHKEISPLEKSLW